MRPKTTRRIGRFPVSDAFKPRGIPSAILSEVVLSLDEVEALRLADLEGMYQEDAANSMGVSRQTFGRIVTSARGKVANALVNGKMIRMEGGYYEEVEGKVVFCSNCGTPIPDELDSVNECSSCRGGAARRR